MNLTVNNTEPTLLEDFVIGKIEGSWKEEIIALLVLLVILAMVIYAIFVLFKYVRSKRRERVKAKEAIDFDAAYARAERELGIKKGVVEVKPSHDIRSVNLDAKSILELELKRQEGFAAERINKTRQALANLRKVKSDLEAQMLYLVNKKKELIRRRGFLEQNKNLLEAFVKKKKKRG